MSSVTSGSGGCVRGDEHMIFGHRGLNSLTPGDATTVFRCTVDHQMRRAETDADIIAGETVIICRDSTLDRTTNHTGRYNDLTVADLVDIDAEG